MCGRRNSAILPTNIAPTKRSLTRPVDFREKMIIALNDNLAHRVSPDFEHLAHERVDVLPAGIEALARLKKTEGWLRESIFMMFCQMPMKDWAQYQKSAISEPLLIFITGLPT